MKIEKNDELIPTGYGGGMYYEYNATFEKKNPTVEEALEEIFNLDETVNLIKINDYCVYSLDFGSTSFATQTFRRKHYKDRKVVGVRVIQDWYCDELEITLYVEEK